MFKLNLSDNISRMTIVESILLGAVQGITEFLPISSSGHLLIAQELFNVTKSFTYDVLLNIGTLIALIIFFRSRIVTISKDIVSNKKYTYLIYVMAASLPTLMIGFLGSDFFERLGEFTWLIIFMLVSIGVLMIIYGNKNGNRQISRKDAVAIGLMQVLALIPGTSRSGITILTALVRGVNVRAATEFSFMLAIPTISAAILHTLIFNDGISFIGNNLGIVLIGNATSFILGALAIKTLLNILNTKGLVPFGWYRIFLGCLIPLVLLIRL